MAEGDPGSETEPAAPALLRLVLDTGAVLAIMHRRAGALGRLGRYRPRDIVLTSPVAAEIRFGLERLPRSRRRRLLEAEYRRLRELVSWQDWTEAAAGEFGRQKARLERAGALIDDMDVAIGALAVSLRARLATLNARHMRRLAALDVEDWADSGSPG